MDASSRKINRNWIASDEPYLKHHRHDSESSTTPTKEDVVGQLSAAPQWLITARPVNVKPHMTKWVKRYWSCPLWVSLALTIYQMELIGNTFSLWPWEMCLSGVTFLLRCSDSLQRLQSGWRLWEWIFFFWVGVVGYGSTFRGGLVMYNKYTSFSSCRACPLTGLNMCWGFIR